ncbi:hypothetical protein I3843_03G183400 [Carya illinoinensis]|uniref:Uncharacterized protein n=2 Tax=Carya illinoinensis TaxID=32201 RepID=A0A922FMJ3_CARIL|nr:hypothetical protein I3760_03G182000 [Carya illinoinensis]KAG6722846.1 hypothetical protein I3842_03G180900 [Carya illinoinensis]KAG7988351.1 hypothetical protein I3843_03G183400 [Carya illinoinensis]
MPSRSATNRRKATRPAKKMKNTTNPTYHSSPNFQLQGFQGNEREVDAGDRLLVGEEEVKERYCLSSLSVTAARHNKMEPSNGEIDDTQKVESEEEKREVQSVIESSNGELEETQKLELQAEEKKVVVQHVGDVEAVVESVREIVLDGDSKLVDETSDGGDRGLRSSSFDKEETLNEKSSEVVYSGELEEETEVSSSVADSVPVVSLSKDFIQGVEELVENSIGLESKEREEKASLSSDNTEIRISRVESSDENNVSSDALTDVVSKGIEETTFPNLDVPVVVTDVVSEGIGETKLLSSDASVGEASKENVKNLLQPLASAPVVERGSVVEEGNKTEIPESSGNPHVISLDQRTLQPTSWRSCCGLFEVLRRSDR